MKPSNLQIQRPQMSEHIPAWKRIGLKVKEELSEDPLAVTAHLDTGDLATKQAKKLQKRARSAASTGEKKPPKRAKLPKSERGPPPEKDQLVYLKQYTDDKTNWKFSKQKQNWILKHVKVIEDKYEPYLVNYFEGLQGGSQDRMVEILRGVVNTWNKMQEEAPRAVQATTEATDASEDASTEKPKKKDENDELTRVDADYATRAKKLLGVMIEEDFFLKGIDDVEKKPEEPTQVTPQNGASLEASSSDSSSSSSSSEVSPASEDTAESADAVMEEDDQEAEEKTSAEEQSDNEATPVVQQTKDKKSKKDKKKKVYNNLSIEQVEATEWVSPEDYVDAPIEEPIQEADVTETSDKKKSKKVKKEKKKSKKSKRED